MPQHCRVCQNVNIIPIQCSGPQRWGTPPAFCDPPRSLARVSGVVSAAVSDLYADAVRKFLMKPKTLPVIPRFRNLSSRPDCHIISKADWKSMKTPTEQPGDGKTVPCTIVHRAVKVISQITSMSILTNFPCQNQILWAFVRWAYVRESAWTDSDKRTEFETVFETHRATEQHCICVTHQSSQAT